jgi:tRNA (uracil-5-)-methyltransferase
VQDAKANDPEYEVMLARVEDGIKTITEKYRGQRIIGILDPPRAGVNKDVITALRRCRGLDHIIYVACSPSSIQDNLLQLTLPVTNKRKAPEFVIKQMFGFDLFPQTKHFEALYYLQRT